MNVDESHRADVHMPFIGNFGHFSIKIMVA